MLNLDRAAVAAESRGFRDGARGLAARADAGQSLSINARLASRGFGGNSGAVKDVLGRPPRQTRVRISNGQRRVRPLRFVNEAARPVGDTEGQVTVGAFNPPNTSYLRALTWPSLP